MYEGVIQTPNQEIAPKTLEDVTEEFEWDKSELEPGRIVDDINSFYDRNPDLGLPEKENILSSLNLAFGISRKVYEILREDDADGLIPKLSYHNLTHAQLTALWAFKEYLGYCAEEKRTNVDFRFNQREFDLILTTVALHEIDDWWNLTKSEEMTGDDSSDEKNEMNRRMEVAKEKIIEHLKEKGLSKYDFNIAIGLDDFIKTPDQVFSETVKIIRAINSGEEMTDVSFLLDIDKDEKDEEKRKSMYLNSNNPEDLIRRGTAISCSADFMQVINDEYTRLVTVLFPDGTERVINIGAIILALECIDVRPNAAGRLKWVKKEKTAIGNVLKLDWQKIGTSSLFYNKTTWPRIFSTLHYLDQFYGGYEKNKAREKLEEMSSKVEFMEEHDKKLGLVDN